MRNESTYKDYYLRTINNHSTGIKLVLGGTGLGKTYGMRQAVKEYLSSNGEKGRKFIYITNRHNLITEQKREFEKSGFNCCYLKSNKDIILNLLLSDQFDELIEDLETNRFFKYDEFYKNKIKRKSKFNQLISGIESKFQITKAEKQKNFGLIKTIEKELNFECDELFKIFKSNLILIARNDEKLYNTLIKNDFVWKLFPYVEFENNPKSNILLVTIQKVLRGFFDGKRILKLLQSKTKSFF